MKGFAEKLIERLEEKCDIVKVKAGRTDFHTLFKYEKDYGTYMTISEVIKIVNQLVKEYNNGWISVKKRLPTEEGSYLVVGKTGGATVTRWYAPSKYHPNGHFGGNSARYIRYWMPRPEAPCQLENNTKGQTMNEVFEVLKRKLHIRRGICYRHKCREQRLDPSYREVAGRLRRCFGMVRVFQIRRIQQIVSNNGNWLYVQW